ncbi:MAG: ATP-binding protein [Candidatus Glassbacteria bacterium]
MEPLEAYGQDKVREFIQKSASSGMLGNSILFEGPFGVGKERMAFWLAQLILCDSRSGCGQCPPCRKVERLTHPDLLWMIPSPGGETVSLGEEDETKRRQSEREKFLQSAVEGKRCEPFFIPRSNRPLGHSAESLRQLLLWCAKKPFEADRKVVIIRDADSMAPGIANLFLKLLEEPPLDTVLILTSTAPHRLLATVLSRCVSYRFPLVDDRHIEAALTEFRGVRGKRASLLAGLAQGSLLRALELADEDVTIRQDALKLFGIASVGRIKDCYEVVNTAITNRYGRDRGEILDRKIFFMILVLRDFLILSEGGDVDLILNTDLLDRMRKLEGKWNVKRVGELIMELERTRRDLRHNVNIDLALWKTIDSVRLALHQGHPL